jgi:hypothetical protein
MELFNITLKKDGVNRLLTKGNTEKYANNKNEKYKKF